MLKFDILKKSKIEISCHLSSDDYRVLNLLYLPLIKADALCFYMVFYNLLNQQNLSLEIYNRDLLDILGMSERKFQKNIEILEAIGLINTYCSDVSFLYYLLPPQNSKQFFLDGILGGFLLQVVGDKIKKNLEKLFIIDHTIDKSYQNISKSFDEVFDYHEINESIMNENYYVDNKSKNKIFVKSNNFNFDLFLNLIDIDKNFIKTVKFKEFILKNAFIYNLSELNFKDIFEQLNEDFSYENMKNKISDYFNKNTKNNKLSGDVMFALSKKSMFEILSIILKREPLISELDDLRNLNAEYKLSNDSFNLIVIYIIIKNKLSIPHINYFKKVFEDFIGKNLLDSMQILKYLQEDKVIKTKMKQTVKKQEPAWLQEFIDNYE